jgi:hypothetical protein
MAEHNEITFADEKIVADLISAFERELSPIKIVSSQKRQTSFEALFVVSITDDHIVSIADADDTVYSIYDTFYDFLMEKIFSKLKQLITNSITKNNVVIVIDQSVYDFVSKFKTDENLLSSQSTWSCLLM